MTRVALAGSLIAALERATADLIEPEPQVGAARAAAVVGAAAETAFGFALGTVTGRVARASREPDAAVRLFALLVERPRGLEPRPDRAGRSARGPDRFAAVVALGAQPRGHVRGQAVHRGDRDHVTFATRGLPGTAGRHRDSRCDYHGSMRIAILVVCGVSLVGSFARAQDAPPGEPPPGQVPPAPPPPPVAPPPAMVAPPAAVTTVDPGTLEDANSGRVAIMSTALTPPAGTFAFEDWELFLISASYAVTDHLVITGTSMVPVTSDFYWGFLSAKLQVVKVGRVRIAAQAGIAAVWGNGSDSSDSATGFDLGGVATLCLDDGCYSHVDGAVVAGFADQSNTSVPVGFMAGIVAKVGRHIRLVAEADTAHMFGDLSGQANGFLGWYGVRFTSRQIGVDLELVRPFCSDSSCDMTTFPLGVPFVTFTYRAID
ncbi:MAG TPA: hypothetical protein VLX92_11280 [Kofleriaceae bacterium]|nr:hypothetical protein [Kofleriaceae bacterium]